MSTEEFFREPSPFAFTQSVGSLGRKGQIRLSAMGMIPPWDREIWRRYGNKLRLGSVGVMDLDQA
jgi:hypothetical protein